MQRLKRGCWLPLELSPEFTRVCHERAIEHELANGAQPWPHGRVAGIERKIRDRVTFASEAYIAGLLQDFVQAYNYRRRLKTLRGTTPLDFICGAWGREPHRFLRDPHHGMPGLEIVPNSSPRRIYTGCPARSGAAFGRRSQGLPDRAASATVTPKGNLRTAFQRR